ncbi:MAG TPA: 23S rRNA (adenine(2503)-C(2))-methyltransferase RlmN [Candidatus Binatia bacterium]|jgi:23S rRNA (adenine2503-C2)-methyltransferase|nr:23S rRNA (adenine(2503)-C(2))-methyltransferase RlmN [Candidatus Binatia bacterium]
MPTTTPLLAMTTAELAVELGSRTRALELTRWLWRQPVLLRVLPDVVDGVSGHALRGLRTTAMLESPVVQARVRAGDGTTKYALDFAGTTVETVRIPAAGRSTVCVSSQAGCTRTCVFCATKELGFLRQLTAAEMLAQFFVARAEAPPDAPARNVVFMGMGEPMDNLDEVLRAVDVLTQSPAPQLRARQVTVSTSGVLPGMRRFLAESTASLALSLNATTDETRERLMPQTRTWPIAALLGALHDDAVRSPKRLTFVEYVLFAGLNDTDADADRLVQLLRGLRVRVNVIPHNPFPGSTLVPPSADRVRAFQERVLSQGIICLRRQPRGRDIAAACGQLVLARSGDGFSPPNS